jgi:hypothetical protein
MLEERSHGTHKGTQARGTPIHRLILLKPLATALEESLALALLELELITHQPLGQRIWGNDQEVINPEAVRWEDARGLFR